MVRGRPRKTDPDKALEAAMLVFWQKGYEGTSMNDLVQATGMAKPGLYATFGDKEALYTKALTYYHVSKAEPVLSAFERTTEPLRGQIQSYLEQMADQIAHATTPQACFVVNSVTECRGEFSPLKEAAIALNRRRVEALTRGFELAKARGEIPVEADCEQLAEFFSGQTAALSVMGQTNGDRQTMQKVIEMAMTAWPH